MIEEKQARCWMKKEDESSSKDSLGCKVDSFYKHLKIMRSNLHINSFHVNLDFQQPTLCIFDECKWFIWDEIRFDAFFLQSLFLYLSLSLSHSLFHWSEFKYSIHFDTAVLCCAACSSSTSEMEYSSLAFVIKSSEIKIVAGVATTNTHMLPVIVVCLSLVTNQPRTR